MKVSVIMPAYNEAANLDSILPGIYEAVGQDCEIIVINDASTDNTLEIAQKHGARVVSNPYNMGNGAAVKRGIREASNDIVVMMDADGQHPPGEIPRLVKEMDKFDMVIGARVSSRQVWWRKIVNSIYNALASYVSDVKIDDLTSGFRAFKREKALKFLYLLPNTFSYPTTLTLSFIKSAYPIKFVALNVLPRNKGKSKINLFSDGFRFFVIILRIAVFYSPLKVFLPLAGFFFSAGFLYYLYTFINYHRFTNMSALLLTTSIIIFILGLISEQITSLKMEKSN